MAYVYGAIAGIILGGIVGVLKNRFIWGDYLKKDEDFGEAGALYGRMMASNVVNVAVLAAAFFLRNIVPFDGVAFLIGTAVALTVMNRVLTTGQKNK